MIVIMTLFILEDITEACTCSSYVTVQAKDVERVLDIILLEEIKIVLRKPSELG